MRAFVVQACNEDEFEGNNDVQQAARKSTSERMSA